LDNIIKKLLHAFLSVSVLFLMSNFMKRSNLYSDEFYGFLCTLKLFCSQKNASVTFITWFITIHMALNVGKTLWLQNGYYFAHLQRAVVLESVRKWVTETTHTWKGHMYTIRRADVTYGTRQNCNMVCYFVTVEGHFWAHLWNLTITRIQSTISWNYSGWNVAYREKQ